MSDNCDINHVKHNWIYFFSSHLTLKNLAFMAVLKSRRISSSFLFEHLPKFTFKKHGIILDSIDPSNTNLYTVISYKEHYEQINKDTFTTIYSPLATIRLRRNLLR